MPKFNNKSGSGKGFKHKQNNFKKKHDKFNKFNENGKRGRKGEAGPKKKKSLNVVFDPEARKDFITGFHKRNLEKKQHYKLKLASKIAEEKLRIQAEARRPKIYHSSSHSILPEVEALLAADADDRNPFLNSSESFEVGSKTVTISSIDPTLHAPASKTDELNEDDDDNEFELDEGSAENPISSSGNWKTVVKKGKTKMVYKADANRLLQNTPIFKKVQRLKQKSKKHRPKPNPHFKPKVVPGSSSTSASDSKGGKGSSKNNSNRKGKFASKKGKSKGR